MVKTISYYQISVGNDHEMPLYVNYILTEFRFISKHGKTCHCQHKTIYIKITKGSDTYHGLALLDPLTSILFRLRGGHGLIREFLVLQDLPDLPTLCLARMVVIVIIVTTLSHDTGDVNTQTLHHQLYTSLLVLPQLLCVSDLFRKGHSALQVT